MDKNRYESVFSEYLLSCTVILWKYQAKLNYQFFFFNEEVYSSILRGIRVWKYTFFCWRSTYGEYCLSMKYSHECNYFIISWMSLSLGLHSFALLMYWKIIHFCFKLKISLAWDTIGRNSENEINSLLNGEIIYLYDFK